MESVPKATFLQEYQAWQDETRFRSTDQGFDNEHYLNIVAMGKGVVSYIHDIIKKTPDPIAYFLYQATKAAIKNTGMVTNHFAHLGAP